MFSTNYHVELLYYMHLMVNRIIYYTTVLPKWTYALLSQFCREIRNMIFQKWGGGGSNAVWNFSSFRFFAQVMVLELLISSSAPIGAYTFALETSLRCHLQNLINCLKTQKVIQQEIIWKQEPTSCDRTTDIEGPSLRSIQPILSRLSCSQSWLWWLLFIWKVGKRTGFLDISWYIIKDRLGTLPPELVSWLLTLYRYQLSVKASGFVFCMARGLRFCPCN